MHLLLTASGSQCTCPYLALRATHRWAITWARMHLLTCIALCTTFFFVARCKISPLKAEFFFLSKNLIFLLFICPLWSRIQLLFDVSSREVIILSGLECMSKHHHYHVSRAYPRNIGLKAGIPPGVTKLSCVKIFDEQLSECCLAWVDGLVQGTTLNLCYLAAYKKLTVVLMFSMASRLLDVNIV